MDSLNAGGSGQQRPKKRPPQQPAQPPVCQLLGSANLATTPQGRQNTATRRNTQREEGVNVPGPVKKQQTDGMSHRGGGGDWTAELAKCKALSSLCLSFPQKLVRRVVAAERISATS